MRNNDFYKIVEDLNKLGINKGDKVLIHSSYRSLGGVEGGPDTLFDTSKNLHISLTEYFSLWR